MPLAGFATCGDGRDAEAAGVVNADGGGGAAGAGAVGAAGGAGLLTTEPLIPINHFQKLLLIVT